MSSKLEVGQIVIASVQRSGGKRLQITGKVVGFRNDFGRDEVVVGGDNVEEFSVSRKNVKIKNEKKSPKS